MPVKIAAPVATVTRELYPYPWVPSCWRQDGRDVMMVQLIETVPKLEKNREFFRETVVPVQMEMFKEPYNGEFTKNCKARKLNEPNNVV